MPGHTSSCRLRPARMEFFAIFALAAASSPAGGCLLDFNVPPAANGRVVRVDSVTPREGFAGDVVRLQGAELGGDVDEAQAFFGGVPGRVQALAADATWMDVLVPEGASDGPVSVLAWGQQAAGPDHFQFLGRGHLAHLEIAGQLPLWRDVRAATCLDDSLWFTDARYRVAADTLGRVLPLQTGEGPLVAGPGGKLWILDEDRGALLLVSPGQEGEPRRVELPGPAAPDLVNAAPSGWLGLYPERFETDLDQAEVWLLGPLGQALLRVGLPARGGLLPQTIGLVAAGERRFVALTAGVTEGGGGDLLSLFEISVDAQSEEIEVRLLGELDAADPLEEAVLALHAPSGLLAALVGSGSVGLASLGPDGLEPLPGTDSGLRWLQLVPGYTPQALRLGPQGRLVYLVDARGDVHAYGAESGRLLGGAAVGPTAAGIGGCDAGSLVLVPLGPLGEIARFVGGNGQLLDRAQPWVAPRSLLPGARPGLLHLLAGGRLVTLDMQSLSLGVGGPTTWADRQLLSDPEAPGGVLVLRSGLDDAGSDLRRPDGEVVLRVPAGELGPAVALDGVRLAGAVTEVDEGGALRSWLGLWDLSSGAELDRWPFGEAAVQAITALPGSRVAIASAPDLAALGGTPPACTVDVLATGSGTFEPQLPGGPAEIPCDPVALLADARAGVLYVVTTAAEAAGLSLVRLVPSSTDGPATTPLPLLGSPQARAALSPDGRWLYVAPNAGLGGIVAFAIDPEGHALPRVTRLVPVDHGVGIYDLAVTPTGERAFALTTDQRILLLE